MFTYIRADRLSSASSSIHDRSLSDVETTGSGLVNYMAQRKKAYTENWISRLRQDMFMLEQEEKASEVSVLLLYLKAQQLANKLLIPGERKRKVKLRPVMQFFSQHMQMYR